MNACNKITGESEDIYLNNKGLRVSWGKIGEVLEYFYKTDLIHVFWKLNVK